MRADDIFSVADILTSSVKTGEIRLNLGDVATGAGIAAEAPFYGLDGFISRPNDSDAAGAAQALYCWEGNQKRVVSTRDNRWASATGAPKSGDRFIVSNCAARFLLKRETSAITLYTENQADGNTSQLIDLNGQAGSISLVCGGSAILMTKDSVTIACAGQTLTIDSSGFSFMGKYFLAATGGGCLGTLGPITPPPGIGSICVGPAGMTAAGSSKWTCAS